MNSEWTEQELGDLLETVIDHRGRTPKKLGGDFTTHGIPVISAKNIKDSRLVLEDAVRYIPTGMWDRWMPVKLSAGDVLLTSEAPLGETAYLAGSDDLCLGQRLFALRADSRRLHSRYLFYALQGPTLRSQILARASGTTAQGIRQAELVRVPVSVPPVGEQQRVARILSSLDDKIENNRRLAKTLEEIAAALFKARFVDFVGHDDLVESEIGPIPRRWLLGTIADLCDRVRNGGTPRRMEPNYWQDGTINWFKTGELDGGFLPQRSDRRITERGLAESSCVLFPRGTVLLAIYAAPTVGRLGILDSEATCNQACTALVPKDEVGYPFLYFALDALREYFNVRASGSAQQNISKKIVESAPIALPPGDALSEFDRVALPLLERIARSLREIETLVRVRDALLPRLISGEIRVPPDLSLASEAT